MRTLSCALMLCALATSAAGQLPDEDYRGITATGLALRELATTKRVLVIAAHPDDEDTQLISLLSLKHGADVAYLSLTRGEGGQNSIGPELGPALGIVRTGELLAARELDRAEQLFTRAYDFGYSKSAAETLRHWPRDSVLADVVGVVRGFRPDIIVAVFSGTPSDGHGQHQVSGMLAREAFSAAADPGRFPQQLRAGLRPHRTLKLFQSANFRGTPTHRLSTGDLDPLLGRSYSQIAAASRSRHRSQNFGQAQTLGPRTTAVALIESRVGVGADGSLFAGIDTTLSARALAAGEAAAVVRALQRYDSLVAAAREQLSPYRTDDIVPLLAAAVRELRGAMESIGDYGLLRTAERKHAAAESTLLRAAGVVIDPVSSTERIIAGEAFGLAITVWNGGSQPIRITELKPSLPPGWQSERTDTARDTVAAGGVVTRSFAVRPPGDAAISQPYFLATARAGDIYAWPADLAVAGQPFEPAPVRAAAGIVAGGVAVSVTRPASARVVDPRQGELRRAVHVAPAFALRPEPAVAMITLARLASGADRVIAAGVEVTSNGSGGTVAVEPQLPPGWRAVPTRTSVTVSGAGQSRPVRFTIEPPRGVQAGAYDIGFVATDASGRSHRMTQRSIDYPHIVNRVIYEPATLHVHVLDARFARGMRIGYIVGVDAQVPPVLEQLGMIVDRLDETALAMADLGKYDAIVIGSRAYEVRPDLIAYNPRVLDYARQGGNLVVLYQQYEFIQGNFAPFALTLARPHDRITDESSPVRILDPGAVALTRPNRIGAADFAGWVQERALYMPNTWAAEYRPLLEMDDPNEAPKQGAILTAPLGSGFYTYTGIAFFRQIPAGVPGALRLFINLLSLGMKDGNL